MPSALNLSELRFQTASKGIIMTDRNETLFNRAKAIIPGGVNSPVRAFGSVGGVSRFIKKAEDAYVWDENGTRLTMLRMLFV